MATSANTSPSRIAQLVEQVKARTRDPRPPYWRKRLRSEKRMEEAVQTALAALEKSVVAQLRAEAPSTKEDELFDDLIGAKAVQDVATDPALWLALGVQFQERLRAELETLFLDGILAVEDIGISIDPDQANTFASELAEQYTNRWWESLAETTRERLRAEIKTHIDTGTPMRDLVERLKPLFGAVRAESIAITETTRIYSEANRAAYKAMGITTVEWRTVHDSRVDPLCAALDGQRFDIGLEPYIPPRHPRCRCWLAPVVDDKAITSKKEFDAMFEGVDFKHLPGKHDQRTHGRGRGRKLPQFSTIGEAEDYMNKHYGPTRFSLRRYARSSGIEEVMEKGDHLQTVLQAHAELAQKYPKSAASIRTVDTTDLNEHGGMFGMTDFQHASVSLNSGLQVPGTEADRMLREATMTGHLSTDKGIRHVYTHEFGHVVQAQLVRSVLGPDASVREVAFEVQHPTSGGVSGAFFGDVMRDRGFKLPSNYAHHSFGEAFAECFAERELKPKSGWSGSTKDLDALLEGVDA